MANERVKGIIIAGGAGTRLRPLTYTRPKPLVPLVNRPFLEYQVALFRYHGIDDIVFATNYMAETIESHFGDGSQFGVRMQYAVEESPLGTGGAIGNAASRFPGATVVVLNGDVLADFPINRLLDFHFERGASGTITLAEVPAPNPYGVVDTDSQGRVLGWIEPTEEIKKLIANSRDIDPTGVDHINAGCYVFSPEFIESLPVGRASSVEREVFPVWLKRDPGLFGFVSHGYWVDMGRPEQLMQATRALLSGRVKCELGLNRIAPDSVVAKTVWMDDLTVIGPGCNVAARSRLEGSVLMRGVTVGSEVLLRNVMVDDGCVIEDEVILDGSNTLSPPVLAAGTLLRRGTMFRF